MPSLQTSDKQYMDNKEQVSVKALEIAALILGPLPLNMSKSEKLYDWAVEMTIKHYLDFAIALEPHIRKEDQD
jgi:hypothetical protein